MQNINKNDDFIKAPKPLSARAQPARDVAPCQINKKLSVLSFGLSNYDFDYVKNKMLNQKNYMENFKFQSFTGEIKSLLDISMSANFSSRYYAEVSNRVNTIQSLNFLNGYTPIFLTITLNGCFRKALKGDFSTFEAIDRKFLPNELKYKMNNNVSFTINDLCFFLNRCWHIFIKRLNTKFNKLNKSYIRTFEPHKKDGVPHIHALLYLPDYAVDYALKIYKKIFYAPQNLRKNRLDAEQIKKGDINGFQRVLKNPAGYILKYITKTFINFDKTDEINEFQAWYIKNKVRRFITSKMAVPVWVYRKINFIKKDYYGLNYEKLYRDCIFEWDFEEKYIYFYNPKLNEKIIMENGEIKHFVDDKLIDLYKCSKVNKNAKNRINKLIKTPQPQINYCNSYDLRYKPFKKMNCYEIMTYYKLYDHSCEEPERMAFLENELISRNLGDLVKKIEPWELNKLYDENYLNEIKDDFDNRNVDYARF